LAFFFSGCSDKPTEWRQFMPDGEKTVAFVWLFSPFPELSPASDIDCVPPPLFLSRSSLESFPADGEHVRRKWQRGGNDFSR
jgi:hypothetical protein